MLPVHVGADADADADADQQLFLTVVPPVTYFVLQVRRGTDILHSHLCHCGVGHDISNDRLDAMGSVGLRVCQHISADRDNVDPVLHSESNTQVRRC